MVPQLHVGIDVGCKRHRVGIAGPKGEILEEFDMIHSEEGFRDFFHRVGGYEEELALPVAVAMEGYNGYARPLDRMIQARGYTLYNVNNLKLARFKEVFPGAAKTDAIDTRKILELFHLKGHLPLAGDVLQEVIPVPLVNEKLKRLSRRRRQLVNEKVRIANRMQSDLQAVSPELLDITRNVSNLWFLQFITCREDLRQLARLRRPTILKLYGIGSKFSGVIQEWQSQASFSHETDYVGPMIIQDAKRLLELLGQIHVLDKAMEKLSEDSQIAQRLSSIPGFEKTSIAELAGEIGTLTRFARESGLALYLGMSPLTHQSGQMHRTRTPRQVNRRAKAAMMTAIARHMRCVPESRAYYDKKRSEGKTHNQAIRALGRHLVRVIWSMLKSNRDYEIQEVKNMT